MGNRDYRQSAAKTLLRSLALFIFDTLITTCGTMLAMGNACAIVYVSLQH